jgi:hypothetical protein
MGARYPYYLLKDSREGKLKEAALSRTEPSTRSAHGDIRQGFVYERVPHIMLSSIANNAEIDVIWEQWQETLEPLRAELNAALKQKWEARGRSTTARLTTIIAGKRATIAPPKPACSPDHNIRRQLSNDPRGAQLPLG